MGRPKGSKNKEKQAGASSTPVAAQVDGKTAKKIKLVKPEPEIPKLSSSDVEQALASFLALTAELNQGSILDFDYFSCADEVHQSTSIDNAVGLGGVFMHDDEVYHACKGKFVGSLAERFVSESVGGKNNKVNIAKWTNRVAIWRFFERFYRPVVSRYLQELLPYLIYQMDTIFPEGHPARTGNHETKVKWALNPFHGYGHAFPHILNAWTPIIKKVIKIFILKTRDGASYGDEFKSLGNMAFLFALEKQAMGILSSNKIAQGIPFPNRLAFAIKKEIYSAIPIITGPYKIPIESKHRSSLPYEIGLEDWLKIERNEN